MTTATDVRRVRIEATGGVTLTADEAGDRGNPTVILLHGGGQTRHAWGRAMVTIAEQGWHAINVDLRGHGESDWAPDGRYELDQFSADTRVVAEQFDRPVLVGASLGGLSSLVAIGESAPGHGLARALVLVDVAPRLEQPGVERIRDFMALGLDGLDSLDDVADAVASYMPHRRRPADVSGLAKNVRQRDDGKWVWHWDPRFFNRPAFAEAAGNGAPGNIAEPSNTLTQYDRLAAAARNITVPTLLVRGGVSDIVSPEGAAELKQLIPQAETVDVADAGHMVAGDRNDRFNEAVIEFLARVIRPDGG